MYHHSDVPWVSFGRRSSPDRRSRASHPKVSAKDDDLEQRAIALERTVSALQTEQTWWTWWYENWGRWLQTKVLHISDVMRAFSNAWVGARAVREPQHQERPQRQEMELTSGEGSLGAP